VDKTPSGKKRNTELNPRNRKEDITLRAQGGEFIRKIHQSEASRLLKHLLAELVFEKPPSIQLVVPEDNEKYISIHKAANRSHSTLARNVRMRELQSVHYGNYHVQSPDGTLMFHCGPRKCLWYLTRDLADIVDMNPPTIRLKFQPNGDGHAGDEYYLASKRNECVVCGSQTDLSRHHVVPYLYRRFFPEEIKDHSYHDILLLCCECHERYERSADKLKVKLAEKYDCPVHGLGGKTDHELLRVAKSAFALKKYGEQIPANRKQQLLAIIQTYAGREVAEEDLDEFTELDWSHFYDKENWVSHGQIVVEKANDPQGFVEMWRKHFIDSMDPAYMPKHWDLQRSVYRSD
jgi:hypothetical protein